MTIEVLFTFFGGLVFLLIGILASRHHKWKKIKTYIPIAIGLFFIYISTFGPLSKSKQRIAKIQNIDSINVSSIVLKPTQYKRHEISSIFRTDSLVYDRNLINEVCNRLRKAKVKGAGFLKNPKEACSVEIHFTDNSTIRFGVRKSGATTCISLASDGENGWHYANLDASDFGNLLNNPGK